MSRNILCVVEFDKYPKHVVARATWLAKSHDCNLHLLVSDPVTDFLGQSYVYFLESQQLAESIHGIYWSLFIAMVIIGVCLAFYENKPCKYQPGRGLYSRKAHRVLPFESRTTK